MTACNQVRTNGLTHCAFALSRVQPCMVLFQCQNNRVHRCPPTLCRTELIILSLAQATWFLSQVYENQTEQFPFCLFVCFVVVVFFVLFCLFFVSDWVSEWVSEWERERERERERECVRAHYVCACVRVCVYIHLCQILNAFTVAVVVALSVSNSLVPFISSSSRSWFLLYDVST